MPGRAAAAGGPRCRAITQNPRHSDQPRPPRVPVLAPVRVTPPVRPP